MGLINVGNDNQIEDQDDWPGLVPNLRQKFGIFAERLAGDTGTAPLRKCRQKLGAIVGLRAFFSATLSGGPCADSYQIFKGR